MHLSHPFSTFYEQYICIHLWKLVSFCSKNAGFDGVWRCLTYMAPRFVSVWGSMQVLHWANSASGLGMGEKLGKHQKQSGNLRCFCFFPHKVPPKPTKTLQKEMLDHIFKGGLLRTIYDSSIKIYNLPYNIRPYFFWGGFGGFGVGGHWPCPRMLDQDGSDSVGPWSILVFFSCTLAQVTTPWDVRRCLLRGSPRWWHGVRYGESRRFIFLKSCYHVSRCLDTWIIVDHSGSIRGNINCCTAMFALSFSSW